MSEFIIVMGVAGCGKSSVGSAVARDAGLPLVEGDTHHSVSNRDKMSRGVALTDADRDGWLDALARELRDHPQGLVLTCSALKRKYRDRLRAAAPGLRFVWLKIDPATALQRVAARGDSHFFSADLVDSQFAALEPPHDEPGVLALEATDSIAELRAAVVVWRRHAEVPMR
jgi:gluconokinase